METGIQRTGLDLEYLFRGPLNVLGDSVAVRGSRKQRAEDEEVERALQQLYTGWRLAMHCVGILLQLCSVSTNNGNGEVKPRMPANNTSVLTEDVQRPVCRQTLPYRITEGLPVNRPEPQQFPVSGFQLAQ